MMFQDFRFVLSVLSSLIAFQPVKRKKALCTSVSDACGASLLYSRESYIFRKVQAV
jgi:hypothetical protein